MEGLDKVTQENSEELARLLCSHEVLGVHFILRFGHEMNAGWYHYGLQRAAYRAAFRTIAAAMRAITCNVVLMWAPNQASYNPWGYQVPHDSAEFAEVDTNHDGVLDSLDDPYGPWWPGDEWVDWVGLSLYHFGSAPPWNKNTVPLPGELAARINGSFRSPYEGRFDLALRDFYTRFSSTSGSGRGKPLPIAETGALYLSVNRGAPAMAVKGAWWRQALSFDGGGNDAPSLTRLFPDLKLVNWFDIEKQEGDIGLVDWRVSAPDVLPSFRAFVRTQPRLRLRDAFVAESNQPGLNAASPICRFMPSLCAVPPVCK